MNILNLKKYIKLRLTLREEVGREMKFVDMDNNLRFLHRGIWINRILLLLIIIYLAV